MEEKESPSSPTDTPQERMRKRKESFQCQNCGRTFSRAWSLVQHLWTHAEDKPFPCDACGSSFNSVGNLEKHQRMKHKFKNGKSEETDATLNGFDNKKAKRGDKSETDGVLKEPELCQKEEAHRNAAKHKPGENETSNKSEKKSKLKAANNNNNLSCVCSKCGRRFSSKSRLTTHLRFHDGKPIHRCLYCGSEFMSKNHLKIHEKMHTGEKPYKCDHCDRVFHILAKLYAHTLKHHKDASRASESRSQSFMCYECKEQFPTKKQLIEHHSTNHKKERYQCKYCQKRFVYKRFLAHHERSHKREGTAPNEETPEPDKLLGQSKNAPNKMQTANHKSFKCENCGQSFPNKTQLQIHQLSHIGKEPYKCKYCNMSFLNETVLVLHERSHTGEQPYKCDYCGRWFGILGNLYGHIRTQHPDKELPKKERFDSLKALHLQARSQASTVPPSVSQASPQSSVKSSPQLSAKSVTQPSSHTSPQPSPKFVRKPSSLPSPQSPPSSPSSQPAPLPPILKINLDSAKRYICEYCEKGFKTKHHLLEHRYIHTGKPLTCGVCGHGFIRRKKLELHQKCHTGRDLYTCGDCGYKFASFQKLKTHKSKNHPDSANLNNDNYECEYCDETFTSYCLLRKHKEIHTPERAPCKRNKEKEKKETAPTSGSFEEDSGAEKQLTCRDCGTLVKLSCTTLSNVFAVTNLSSVKCFLKNHTII
ncbi:hypothetical protein NL108_014091 [Boleophthalmus pectinirostris]|nr:hypothetical protein NL108_014091 [Boleophthalmus pectinirostris]